MAQEFFIKSADLESKVRQLLPSQGGLGAGQDLSASTQIVPIVDLTETAEGSQVRADLQTALSFKTVTAFSVQTSTVVDLVSNTGYYRVFGLTNVDAVTTSGVFRINDGATTKSIYTFINRGLQQNVPFDFNVFLKAGDILQCSANTGLSFEGVTRQIATIDGDLIDP